ncbi:hypothetical protein WMF11_14300 [Sorangium sp. So ce295]|uniref:hypothetical protein n=1 Tax=Sorangium sp. So ce295 TaxID=3133295 RepID=UPI003F5FA8B4
MTASALAASAVVVAGTAAAAVPATITHQGRLYDERDVPISATLDVVFALYDERDASTPLWSEVHSITFEDGFFSVRLGAIVPFEQAIFDGAERYLGITVGDDVELEPRATVASVPYALLAGNVNGDITPTSVTVNTTSGNTLVLGERGIIVNGVLVIDENGEWVGSPTGLQGPQGLPGPTGPEGGSVRLGLRVLLVRQGRPDRSGRSGRRAPQAPPDPRGRKAGLDLGGRRARQGPQGRQGPWGQKARWAQSDRRARWDQKVRWGQKARWARSDRRVPWDQRALPVPLGQRALPVRQDQWALPVRRGHVGLPALLVRPGPRGSC